MKFKAAVFDLDGTLLDSLADIANSMNAALRSKGYPEHPIPNYKIHVGDGMAILAKRVLPEHLRNESEITALVAAMRLEYGQRWAQNTRPYDGIPELLDALVARGIRLAVLSNKPNDFTREIMATLMPRWTFDPVFGARPCIPNKPDPTSAIEVAALMNLAGAECVFVGDTHADMRAGAGAGMFTVGVLWGFREAQELIESGAQVLIKHPLELLELEGFK